jgi:hypothetical protein
MTLGIIEDIDWHYGVWSLVHEMAVCTPPLFFSSLVLFFLCFLSFIALFSYSSRWCADGPEARIKPLGRMNGGRTDFVNTEMAQKHRKTPLL